MGQFRKIFFLIIFLFSVPCFADEQISDPWEGLNRSIFSFNEGLDAYLAEPAAKRYVYVFPSQVRKRVTNFFKNIRYPQYLVSDLVQFKFSQALDHTARFIINTTVGVGGLFDVASEVGLEHHQEDFGLALAYHGVPSGPYVVLPFMGPSTVRDAFGTFVDRFLNPLYWTGAVVDHDETALAISLGSTALEFIDTRANLIDTIDAAKESSLDYYLFIQSSYYQYREGLLFDGNPPGDDFDDDPFADEYED